MANWPESFQHHPVEFRAPPPSPIASGRRSSVANDKFLTEFLHHSLRVPDLVLPDRVSPRKNSKLQNLPKLDYRLLDSVKPIEEDDSNIEKLDVIARTGCFELVNHGISNQLIRSVSDYANGIFDLSPEKKAVMSRSGDRMYGFVEFHGEEKETGEEFVWCRDDAVTSKLETLLPHQISNFSENVEILTSEIEKICEIIMKLLLNVDKASEEQTSGTVCYFYRYRQDPNSNKEHHPTNALRYEMIRMLIRGSEHSHTLCVHVCTGSELHVYSKKGWESFCTGKDGLVITVGDQLQRWSEGKYKHVMGRVSFKAEEEEEEEEEDDDDDDDCVSMAFMYNPPARSMPMTVSLGHQVLFLFILALVYRFYC